MELTKADRDTILDKFGPQIFNRLAAQYIFEGLKRDLSLIPRVWAALDDLFPSRLSLSLCSSREDLERYVAKKVANIRLPDLRKRKRRVSSLIVYWSYKQTEAKLRQVIKKTYYNPAAKRHHLKLVFDGIGKEELARYANKMNIRQIALERTAKEFRLGPNYVRKLLTTAKKLDKKLEHIKETTKLLLSAKNPQALAVWIRERYFKPLIELLDEEL